MHSTDRRPGSPNDFQLSGELKGYYIGGWAQRGGVFGAGRGGGIRRSGYRRALVEAPSVTSRAVTADRDGAGVDGEDGTAGAEHVDGARVTWRRQLHQVAAAPAPGPAPGPAGTDPLATKGGSAAVGGAAAATAIALAKTVKGKIDMFKAAKAKVVPLMKRSKDLQERIVKDVEAKKEECTLKVSVIKEKLKTKLEDAKNKEPPPSVDGKEAEVEWRKQQMEKIKEDTAKEAALVMEGPKELEKKYRKEIKNIAKEIKEVALTLPSGEKIIAMIEKGIKIAEEKAQKLKEKKYALEKKKADDAAAKQSANEEKERLAAEKAAEKLAVAAEKKRQADIKKGVKPPDIIDAEKAEKKAAKKEKRKKKKAREAAKAAAPQESDEFADDAELDEEERKKQKKLREAQEKFDETLGGAIAMHDRAIHGTAAVSGSS